MLEMMTNRQRFTFLGRVTFPRVLAVLFTFQASSDLMNAINHFGKKEMEGDDFPDFDIPTRKERTELTP